MKKVKKCGPAVRKKPTRAHRKLQRLSASARIAAGKQEHRLWEEAWEALIREHMSPEDREEFDRVKPKLLGEHGPEFDDAEREKMDDRFDELFEKYRDLVKDGEVEQRMKEMRAAKVPETAPK